MKKSNPIVEVPLRLQKPVMAAVEQHAKNCAVKPAAFIQVYLYLTVPGLRQDIEDDKDAKTTVPEEPPLRSKNLQPRKKRKATRKSK